MPVFTVQTPTGQKLDIEAADEATALQGAQHWHEQQQPSGVVDSLKEGLGNDLLGGAGRTIAAYTGKGPVGDWLQEEGKSIAPENFVPSPIYDKSGFHASGILPTLARAAPSIGAGLTAAGVAAGLAPAAGVVAPMLGYGGLSALQSAGDEAQTAANNRTGQENAPITNADLVKGGAIAAGTGAIGALVPATRILPGAAKTVATGVGTTGVVNAVKRLASTARMNAATGAAQSAFEQGAQTAGTPGGLNIDPTQVANSAAGGAVAGAFMGAKPFYKETANALNYRGLQNDPALMGATVKVANRVQQNAEGTNIDPGYLFTGASQRNGGNAWAKTVSGIENELGAAVSDLKSRVTLPVDADNALSSALKGQHPTAGGYDTIARAIKGDPQADNVLDLLRQKQAASIIEDTGINHNGKFRGGIGSHFSHILTGENIGKTGLVAAGGALLGEGAGHVIAWNPGVLAGAAGATVLAKMLDHLTSAASPAARLVKNFADDGATPVRLGTVPPPPPPAPSPVVTPNAAPLHPPLGGPGQPFGRAPVGAVPTVPPAPVPQPANPYAAQIKDVSELMAARRANERLQSTQRKLRNAALKEAFKTGAHIAGDAFGGPLGGTLAHGAASLLAEMHTALSEGGGGVGGEAQAIPQQQLAAMAQAGQVQPGLTRADPKMVNATKKLVVGLQAMQKLKQANTKPQRGNAPEAPTAPAANVPLVAPPMQPSFTPPTAAASYGPDVAVALSKAKAAMPQITGITKSAGSINTHTSDEHSVPRSPYAGLPAEVAAGKILEDFKKGGGVPRVRDEDFKRGVQRHINDVRSAVASMGQIPGVNMAEVAAQFEGAATRREAIAHREYLKKLFPQAAAALDTAFSDAVINGVKGKVRGMWVRP